MPQPYFMTELTEIGREKFNLSNDWHCFCMKLTDDGKRVRYGLSPKDENGDWLEEEIYSYADLT